MTARLKTDDIELLADSLERDARMLDSLYLSVWPRMEGFKQRARRDRFLAKKLRNGDLELKVKP